MVTVSNQGCTAVGSAALLGASASAYQSLSALYELTTDSKPSGIENKQTAIQRSFSYLLGGEATSQASKVLRGLAEATIWAVPAIGLAAVASLTLDPKGEIVPNDLAKRFITIEPESKEDLWNFLPSRRAVQLTLSDHAPNIFSPPKAPPPQAPLLFEAPVTWAKHYLWTNGVAAGASGLDSAIRDYAPHLALGLGALAVHRQSRGNTLNIVGSSSEEKQAFATMMGKATSDANKELVATLTKNNKAHLQELKDSNKDLFSLFTTAMKGLSTEMKGLSTEMKAGLLAVKQEVAKVDKHVKSGLGVGGRSRSNSVGSTSSGDSVRGFSFFGDPGGSSDSTASPVVVGSADLTSSASSSGSPPGEFPEPRTLPDTNVQ